MIIVAILAVSVTLVINIIQFSNYVNISIEDDLDRAMLEILNEIEILQDRAAHIASLYFSSNSEVIRLIETGDLDELMTHVLYLFNQTGVEFCAVTDNTGKILIKPDFPDYYGEYLLEMQSIRSAISGTPLTTVEGSKNVNMTACASAPIYNQQGQIIGAVVVGFRLDTEEFVEKHKRISGSEITIYRDDERVATTLLLDDRTSAIGTNAPAYVYEAVQTGNVFLGRTRILDQEVMAKFFPISSYEGNVIGMLFTGRFLAEKVDLVRGFVITGILVVLFLLGVSIPLVLFVSKRMAAPIDKRLDQIRYDALTGVYSRRFFDENINAIMNSLSRSNGSISIMMIDIDHFKEYNDAYGHNEGDVCLKIIAEILSNGLARTDDFVARYGGDEFIIVLPFTDEVGAHGIADKLLENVQNRNIPHKNKGIADQVTISIGVSTGKVNFTQSIDDYVKRADEMLYKTKQNGRNQYTLESI
jgi:diguanylate cyclase (GGDEF)-like protein